jgi:prepilin-type N-terminal cleavage/methylation domain-containing protein
MSRPLAIIRRGFTLLETLVSLALLGVLMVTLNTFLFSMSELWGDRRDQRLFDQHVRAATQVVRDTLASATLGVGASGVSVREVKNGSGTTEPRLAFLLADAGRLADWPAAPLPDVDFSLYVAPEKGLVLQWQSRLELERSMNDLHETVLTPFVTAIHYEYYDDTLKRWEVEDEPKQAPGNGGYLKPARIHLDFSVTTPKGELKATKVIDLPIARTGASRP